MNRSFPQVRGALLTASIAASFAAATPAHAQRLDRTEYLEAVGLAAEADTNRRYLLEGPAMRAHDWPASRQEETAVTAGPETLPRNH